MANFLQTAAKALAGILKPKAKGTPPFNPDSDPNGVIGSMNPVFTPPKAPEKQPIGFNPFESPEVKELIGGIKQAQGVLSQPAPQLQAPKEDPFERLLSVVLAGSNPHAAGRTLQTPNLLAQQRADTANQQTLANFQIGRESAQSTINTNQKLIDIALDRDAVAQRVSGMLKAKEMEGIAKREIATLQQNTQLLKTLANLEATGGITVPAVAAIYSQMGYDYEAAEAIAISVVDQVQKNPSMRMKLEQAKVAIQQTESTRKSENDFWDALESTNLSVTQRFRLITNAIRDGILPPETDAMAMAKELGPQGTLIQEKAETEDKMRDVKVREAEARIDKIVSGIEKDGAQIEKWRQESNRGNINLAWKMSQGGKPSALDNTLSRLRMAKEALLAEAKTWKGQNEGMGGLIKRESPQSNQALAKIQREIAGIDAKIAIARGMGAKEGSAKESPLKGQIGARNVNPKLGMSKQGLSPVKINLPKGIS
jgi:hypothetical protein